MLNYCVRMQGAWVEGIGTRRNSFLQKKGFSKGVVKNKNVALPIKMEVTAVYKHINVQMKKHYTLTTDNI